MTDIYDVEPTLVSQAKPATRRRRRKKKAKRTAAPKQVAPKLFSATMPAPLQTVAIANPPTPVAPSSAVLKLQEQVVDLVSQRNEARGRLTAAHAEYLTAQAKFQAAEANVKAAEQDAQYLLGLIAQLENRTPAPMSAPVLQMPQTMSGVSSEPAPQQRTHAVASADDLKLEMRGMM